MLTDSRVHCVDHYLAVKYDGDSSIYIGGAEPSEVVHTTRDDCGDKP